MEIPDGLLYVEVIGGRLLGESIVVRLPGGQWGVIDCYSSNLNNPDKHPIIQRLKQLNVPTLEFVALTHPHDDHYRGMRMLLEQYPPKRFWMFTGTTPHLLEFLIQYLPAEANAGLPDTTKSSVDDLIGTFEILSERAKAKQINRTFVSGGSYVIRTDILVGSETIPLNIRSFAPHGNIVSDYETRLTQCFDHNSVINRLTSVLLDHNDLSIGFVIEFGKSRVILGGDVVRKTWELVLQADPLNPIELAAVRRQLISDFASWLWKAVGISYYCSRCS